MCPVSSSSMGKVPFQCTCDCSCSVQGSHRRRTGHLCLAPQPDSAGLQALACLYCSDKQQLGYVPPLVPAPVLLSEPSAKLATFLGRLTIEHSSCSSNTSAAEVWRCSIGSSQAVLKSSNRIEVEVSALWPCASDLTSGWRSRACCSAGLDVHTNIRCNMLLYQNLAELDACHLCFQINAFTTVATFVPAIPQMPEYLGMGFSEDQRMWLAMPSYGGPFAGLRDPTSIVAAAKQASAFRLTTLSMGKISYALNSCTA